MTHEACNRFNSLFNSFAAFKELFPLAGYLLQPHVMHLHILERNGEHNPWHSHRTFEFSLLLQGRMTYQVEEVEIAVEAGDAVFVPPDVQHRWKVIGDGDAVVFGLVLYISRSGQGARTHIDHLRGGIARRRYHQPRSAELAAVVERILAAARAGTGHLDEKIRCLAQEACVEMFNAVLPPATPGERRPPASLPAQHLRGGNQRTLCEAVRFFINDNSHRLLQPVEVSRHIGLSLNRLNDIVKNQTDQTLGQLIWARKVFLACSLLDNSNRQIKDIASSLGVEDVAYFCRRFKRHTGLSPSEYRMKNRT